MISVCVMLHTLTATACKPLDVRLGRRTPPGEASIEALVSVSRRESLLALRQQLPDPRDDLGAVELDAAHHRLVGQLAGAVLEVEPADTECGGSRCDLARHGLGRPDVERATGTADWSNSRAWSAPSRARRRSGRASSANAATTAARLLVGGGDVARRMHADR